VPGTYAAGCTYVAVLLLNVLEPELEEYEFCRDWDGCSAVAADGEEYEFCRECSA
jgi:hypothetical protein